MGALRRNLVAICLEAFLVLPMSLPAQAALLLGHPGHELRIYHWLELNRPVVFCLTDGSGHAEVPRMDSTSRLLAQVGARRGTVYGRASDKAFYRLLMEGRADYFGALVDELARALIAAEVTMVAGDAAEGFSPTHDLARFLLDAAVARVRHLTNKTLPNFEFTLEAAPDACPAHLRDRAIWLRLNEEDLARKVAAARDYPELRPEVETAIQHFGTKAFAIECLYPANTQSMIRQWEDEPPGYDQLGRQRVRDGRYPEAISYRKHVWPILEAIEGAVARA